MIPYYVKKHPGNAKLHFPDVLNVSNRLLLGGICVENNTDAADEVDTETTDCAEVAELVVGVCAAVVVCECDCINVGYDPINSGCRLIRLVRTNVVKRSLQFFAAAVVDRIGMNIDNTVRPVDGKLCGCTVEQICDIAKFDIIGRVTVGIFIISY